MAAVFIFQRMEEKKPDISPVLADIVTGARHKYWVGGRRFCFYPVTLAKTFKAAAIVKSLGMNPTILKMNPYVEALRLAEKRRGECCTLLSLHSTPNTMEDFFNDDDARERAAFLNEHLSRDGMAMLLIYVLTADKTDQIAKFYGMDIEQEKLQKIMEIKSRSKSTSVSYGGKSIFGSMFSQLKEMGYTDNEMLYERPYSFLQLMVSDKPNSIYLSEEEYQSLPQKYGGSLMVADDPGNIADLEKFLGDKGMSIYESD